MPAQIAVVSSCALQLELWKQNIRNNDNMGFVSKLPVVVVATVTADDSFDRLLEGVSDNPPTSTRPSSEIVVDDYDDGSGDGGGRAAATPCTDDNDDRRPSKTSPRTPPNSMREFIERSSSLFVQCDDATTTPAAEDAIRISDDDMEDDDGMDDDDTFEISVVEEHGAVVIVGTCVEGRANIHGPSSSSLARALRSRPKNDGGGCDWDRTTASRVHNDDNVREEDDARAVSTLSDPTPIASSSDDDPVSNHL
eukprot:CAMPEP_0181097702 /NCGR_PEP_ID=MMETSP1071-20121207/11712_1 /TAXON_ID=35127 /ORGANISM="Thalassiosira sp., Strain NH16" /LENGTH=251 /DNA_ID=CAMNT_0023180205 /DNA_START=183 /DNA_END=936 /DNA_ORIENTATION=-